MRTAIRCGAGTRASTRFTIPPTRKTFETVPRPGRCRSNTAAPMMIVQVPIPSPNVRDSPWCRTSHGSRPSPASTSIASLIPYSSRPPYS
jgi:hypothetical protein